MTADAKAPYRDAAPLVVHEGDPPGRRWVIHAHLNFVLVGPFGNEHGCRWCTYRDAPKRGKRCFGRRAWFGFGRAACPPRAHHHVECVHCGRDWLEATCDEAEGLR